MGIIVLRSPLHIVVLLWLITAFVFGIVACALGYRLGALPDNGRYNVWKAFIIIGIISTGIAAFGELVLLIARKSRHIAFYIVVLFWVLLAAVSFLIASAVISAVTFTDFGVVAVVMAMQALVLYLLQWHCYNDDYAAKITNVS